MLRSTQSTDVHPHPHHPSFSPLGVADHLSADRRSSLVVPTQQLGEEFGNRLPFLLCCFDEVDRKASREIDDELDPRGIFRIRLASLPTHLLELTLSGVDASWHDESSMCKHGLPCRDHA